MKQISKFLAPVAFAAAAFCAPQAYAANQNAQNAAYLGNGTYIRIVDPRAVPVENSFITSTSPVANQSFTDYWVFDVNPTGNVVSSLSFANISNSFTAFSVQLYRDQSPLTNPATANYTIASQSRFGLGGILSPINGAPASPLTLVAQASSSFGLGSQLGGASTITTGFLTAGRYVAEVKGTVSGGTNPTYSGQIQVNQIPEPGSLALAGLALLGAASAMRKRKA